MLAENNLPHAGKIPKHLLLMPIETTTTQQGIMTTNLPLKKHPGVCDAMMAEHPEACSSMMSKCQMVVIFWAERMILGAPHWPTF